MSNAFPSNLAEVLLVPILRVGLILTRQARTLGSVGILVSDGRVMLVRTWYRVDWGLPGGYLRRGEDPSSGLLRELFEETGLRLPRPSDPPLFVFQRNRRHIDFVFTVDLDGQATARGKSREITSIEWFALDELPPLQPEADAALRAAGVR